MTLKEMQQVLDKMVNKETGLLVPVLAIYYDKNFIGAISEYHVSEYSLVSNNDVITLKHNDGGLVIYCDELKII